MALTKAQERNAEKNRLYWAEREEAALTKYKKSEAEYDKEIKRIYADMLDSVQTQINDFYGRYAAKEGITLAEAKKRVKSLDIAKYERKAAKYVKDKDFSDKANEEMRLYNATMKINRLEMLKANIGLETIAGHNELEKFMSKILRGRTEEELKRQAGILGKTIRNNAQLAHAIPNASFHNATFSDRIWQYQDLMRADLSKMLETGLIQGKNPRAIAKDLRKYWYGNDPRTGGGATYCMERLMRTELARVQTEAQKQSFEKNGFTEYEFIANRDCCDICKEKDGKHFKVKDMMPGENAAPLHPHCRCSVAAYEDSKEYDEWLSFLEKGGTTAEYNELKVKGLLTNITKGAIMSNALNNKSAESIKLQSGARILNPYSDEGEEFAEKYYAEVVTYSTDTAQIAINTGRSKEEIDNIKNYLFKTPSFVPDCAIAHSWQRLILGKDIKAHDLLLIEHELYEMELKKQNPGIEHSKAHTLATLKYNYQKAADEYYGNLKKRNKNK